MIGIENQRVVSEAGGHAAVVAGIEARAKAEADGKSAKEAKRDEGADKAAEAKKAQDSKVAAEKKDKEAAAEAAKRDPQSPTFTR